MVESDTLPDPAKLSDYVRSTKVVKDDVTSNVGNTAEAMDKDGTKTLRATYDFAVHTHGSIGRPAPSPIQGRQLTFGMEIEFGGNIRVRIPASMPKDLASAVVKALVAR